MTFKARMSWFYPERHNVSLKKEFGFIVSNFFYLRMTLDLLCPLGKDACYWRGSVIAFIIRNHRLEIYESYCTETQDHLPSTSYAYISSLLGWPSPSLCGHMIWNVKDVNSSLKHGIAALGWKGQL